MNWNISEGFTQGCLVANNVFKCLFTLKVCGSRGKALLEKAIHSNVSPHLNIWENSPYLFYFNVMCVCACAATCSLQINYSWSSFTLKSCESFMIWQMSNHPLTITDSITKNHFLLPCENTKFCFVFFLLCFIKQFMLLNGTCNWIQFDTFNWIKIQSDTVRW